jgi:hypothetical protein
MEAQARLRGGVDKIPKLGHDCRVIGRVCFLKTREVAIADMPCGG